MAEFEKHLYVIVFPINALVSSQLSPTEFAQHYAVGSAKHFRGKVIFVEVDITFRNQYFDIDHYLALTVPKTDGTPKKTKFISSYAVLEHIDLRSLKNLYLVTTNGKALEIASRPYTATNEPGLVRIYQEITPLSNLVVSTLDQRAFGKYITSETKSKGAPKICFTQFEFNVAEFMEKNKNREMMYSPIPETNPTRLYEYLVELKTDPSKKTKTISLNTTLMEASYGLIRHGFWFAAGTELLFYPMPSQAELQRDHFEWWRHVR
ncbi:MAG TPA: hypothetical protein DGH68_02010 [Bacteroidetes bacterium]|jgi:hypothetical protein|nr:hypothetical protein [Bacteroidota bacterium]